MQADEVGCLAFQDPGVLGSLVSVVEAAEAAREEDGRVRLSLHVVVHGDAVDEWLLIWRHDARVALEELAVEEDADPACEVGLHPLLVVLLDLREDITLAYLVQLVLDALHHLAHDEVLVHEHEEEALEQRVQAQEAVAGDANENLRDKLAEKLGFVEDVLVDLGQLL